MQQQLPEWEENGWKMERTTHFTVPFSPFSRRSETFPTVRFAAIKPPHSPTPHSPQRRVRMAQDDSRKQTPFALSSHSRSTGCQHATVGPLFNGPKDPQPNLSALGRAACEDCRRRRGSARQWGSPLPEAEQRVTRPPNCSFSPARSRGTPQTRFG